MAIDAELVGVIMTGQGTIDTAVEAMQTGALDYILKPFKLSVILPVLSRALTIRRLRLKNAELEQQVRGTHRRARDGQQGSRSPFPIRSRTTCAPHCEV